jgi:hypothetical protein
MEEYLTLTSLVRAVANWSSFSVLVTLERTAEHCEWYSECCLALVYEFSLLAVSRVRKGAEIAAMLRLYERVRGSFSRPKASVMFSSWRLKDSECGFQSGCSYVSS